VPIETHRAWLTAQTHERARTTVTNQPKPSADEPGRADPPSGSGPADIGDETPEGKQ